MNRIEKTGRTVDDAVQAALKELGVSREDVLIEVLEEGKDALFWTHQAGRQGTGYCKGSGKGCGTGLF